MAGFGNKVKTAVLKSMEAVGQSASNLAANAQQKLQELNLETQRREILSDFPLKAYDLWQKGETMPEPLAKLLQELSELDERLSVLRAQRYTHVDIPDAAQDGDSENASADENADAEGSAITDGSDGAQNAENNENTTSEEAAPQDGYANGDTDASAAYVDQHPDTPMDAGEHGDNA